VAPSFPAPQGRHVRFTQVSSMNTSREESFGPDGLPSRPLSRHVCPSARNGFFEAQPLGVNEHPHRARMRLDPPFGQFGRQALQGERPGCDAHPQPVGAIARERAGFVIADLSRGRRARLALALRPLGNPRRADPQGRRNLPVRLTRLLAGQRSFPKVQRIGSRHPCWPPNRA
jgi:hypothetical protein